MIYTKEQLLHYLKSLAKELGRTPTSKEMNQRKDLPSVSTYAFRFGSWNKAIRKTGLEINLVKKYTADELREQLRLLIKELGRRPRTTDLIEREWIASYASFRKYFGSWKEALRAAGLKEGYTDLKFFLKRKYTKKETFI